MVSDPDRVCNAIDAVKVLILVLMEYGLWRQDTFGMMLAKAS